MSRQIENDIPQNGPITKTEVFPVTALFFWKIYSSLSEVPQACNFVKKEILAKVFFCEFCEISKNTFFTEHVLATASDIGHEAKIWQLLKFRTLLTAIFSGATERRRKLKCLKFENKEKMKNKDLYRCYYNAIMLLR